MKKVILILSIRKDFLEMMKLTPTQKAIALNTIIPLAILITFYYLGYPISANNTNIKESIVSFLKEDYALEDITIYDSITIDNRKYVLATLGDRLARIDLVKGIHNAYKIDCIESNTHTLCHDIVDIHKRKYILLKRKNPNLIISKINFILDSTKYSVNIPHTPYFLTYLEIDPNTEDIHPKLDSIKFYNDNQIDITSLIE